MVFEAIGETRSPLFRRRECKPMKSVYADAIDVVNAPARVKKEKALKIVISHQGGETYRASKLSRFTRFLVVGSESGSFYQSAKALTLENTRVAQDVLNGKHGIEAVNEIVRVSQGGLAEKQDAILFSLAFATRSDVSEVRSAAYKAIIPVCRTLSQLCTFLDYRFQLGGVDNGSLAGKKIPNAHDKNGNPISERYGDHASSMGLRRALRNWLAENSDPDLAYQLMKYGTRSGFSMRDILRIARPKPATSSRSELYRFATKGFLGPDHTDLDSYIAGRLNASHITSLSETPAETVDALIRTFDLPRETINTAFLNDPNIWDALLVNMPIGAMLRNLGKMQSVGVLDGSDNRNHVIDRLTDEKRIKGSRLHPMTIWSAMKVYGLGHGIRGSLTWSPDRKIEAALEDAFDLSFKNVEPSGKKILVAIDISGSMSETAHMPTMTSAWGVSALMALVVLRYEPNTTVIGVNHSASEINLSGNERPAKAMDVVGRHIGGGTDLNQPFHYAKKHGDDFDAIMLFTDSENGSLDLRKHQENFCRGGEYRRLMLAQMVPNQYGWIGATGQSWDDVGRKSIEIVGFDPSIGKLASDFLAERF